MKPTAPLRSDRRGASALEFALAAPILLFLMGGLTDVGMLWRTRGKLAVAVDAGAQCAVLESTNATSANVQAAVLAATTLTPAPTVTVSAQTCDCVSATNTLSAATCGSTCPGTSVTTGTYMTISATYTYTSLMGYLSFTGVSTNFTETATVRLQ
jgi:Flp pilus assembly protein TadG